MMGRSPAGHRRAVIDDINATPRKIEFLPEVASEAVGQFWRIEVQDDNRDRRLDRRRLAFGSFPVERCADSGLRMAVAFTMAKK